jgi:hypothetical protein
MTLRARPHPARLLSRWKRRLWICDHTNHGGPLRAFFVTPYGPDLHGESCSFCGRATPRRPLQ